MDLFNEISLKNKAKLLRILRGHNVKYMKNTKIIDHLNDDDDIGYITKGKIEIIRNNYNGSTSIIEDFNSGDLITSVHIYLKDDDTSIITLEDTEIILFSYNTITNLDTKDYTFNQFLKNLFIIKNEEVIKANERIEVLSRRTIRDKLLEYFSVMSRKSGSKYIYLPYNFSDLANYLSIDRSAMSRELGYLKEEGFISIKGKRITLLYR